VKLIDSAWVKLAAQLYSRKNAIVGRARDGAEIRVGGGYENENARMIFMGSAIPLYSNCAPAEGYLLQKEAGTKAIFI
jgi:hypothetical protein